MKKVLIINGPNLNLLGKWDTKIYGHLCLADICEAIEKCAENLNLSVEFFQSNSEGAIIDCIQFCRASGIIINAGAYAHYSYAIRDALAAVRKPVIEVHMSNIFARESHRHTSVISPVCKGQISGFGLNSYLLALQAMANIL